MFFSLEVVSILVMFLAFFFLEIFGCSVGIMAYIKGVFVCVCFLRIRMFFGFGREFVLFMGRVEER